MKLVCWNYNVLHKKKKKDDDIKNNQVCRIFLCPVEVKLVDPVTAAVTFKHVFEG